jgi:hypothetical protein
VFQKHLISSEDASQGLKPAFFQVLNGTAKQAAEKVEFHTTAPKGASDFKEFMSSLKR